MTSAVVIEEEDVSQAVDGCTSDKHVSNGDDVVVNYENAPADTEEVDGENVDDLGEEELFRRVDELVATERYLQAGKLLRSFLAREENNNLTTSLDEKYLRYLRMVNECDLVMGDLIPDMSDGSCASSGWTKQGESHGHRDTIIYYKIDPRTAQLDFRIETPIEASLLNPLIAVLNESDLYETWMPKWTIPRVAIKQSKMLKEFGRGNQAVQVTVDMPFPLTAREVVLHAFAVDDIDGDSQSIIVKIKSLEEEKNNATTSSKETAAENPTLPQGFEVPPKEKRVTRVDMDAGILIRSCPSDHLALQQSRVQYPPNEPLLLVQVTYSIDAHVGLVPTRIINFFTRTVIGTLWASLLQVAEDIRDGKRPQHAQAIQVEKRELYEWIENRAHVLFSNLS